MKKYILLITVGLITSCSETKFSADKTLGFADFSAQQIIPLTATCNANCVEHKKEFRYLAYVGEKIYCYWNEKQIEFKIDFKQKASDLENTITSIQSETEYFLLLTQWAALFHDGHVNAMLRDDLSNIELYDLPVRFEILAPATDHETLIVSKVNAALTSLKVGMIVDKIQGQNWKDLSSQAEKFVSGSTSQMRRRSAGQSIFRLLLETEGPLPVKIEGQYNNKPAFETLSRSLKLYDKSVLAQTESTGVDLIQTAILENNIGYLRIDGFSGSQMRSLLTQAMDRLAQTRGLIIDVRKNGGGDLSGDVVLSRLISSVTQRFSQRTNFSDMLQVLRPSILFDYEYTSGLFSDVKIRTVLPTGTQYKKPVAVISSGYCFSACDTFVSAIKQNKLATVYGESTGGGTGNPQVIELPASGHSFRYSVAQGFIANTNTLLEGVGTEPDIAIEPTAEERMLGKDLQLEKIVKQFTTTLNLPIISDITVLPNQLINVQSKEINAPFEVELQKDIYLSNKEN